MKSISDFFHKFVKISRDIEMEKNRIIDVVKEYTAIDLKPESIAIKDEVLSIQGSPLERTQVCMYKNQIIEKLDSCGIKVRTIK
jgi:hypothetical protein